MIRSAPSCLAASTPSRPTAPSPTTATVLPGSGLGGDGAEPAGAEHVGGGQKVGDQVLVRQLGGGDQGAVGQRHPHPLRLRAVRGAGLPLDAGGLVAGPADLAGVVGGEERADHELARSHGGHRRADLLHDAGVLVTHRRRLDDRVRAAVGPQVRTADAGRGQPDDRIGRLRRSSARARSSTRTSPGHTSRRPRIELASPRTSELGPPTAAGARASANPVDAG